MNDTVFDVASQIFNEVTKKEPSDYALHFSENIKFPLIEYVSQPIVKIPLPRKIDGKIFFEGMIFENYEVQNQTIWSLFLASICHVAGHVAVSDYNIYKKWMEYKTPFFCYKVMDYIEDLRVNQFLQTNFVQESGNIELINTNFTNFYKRVESLDYKKNKSTRFANHFCLSDEKNLASFQQRIVKYDIDKNTDEILHVADSLYKLQEILPNFIFPYCDHRMDEKESLFKTGIKIKPTGEFRDNVNLFAELWVEEEIIRERKFKKYNKYSKDLNIDEVEIGSENFNEYLRLKNKHSMLINKVKSQVRSVTNVRDDPEPWDMGIIDMQKAIQSVASNNPMIKFHDLDMERRIEERWVIILDTSSSMKLVFSEMRKLALCLSESANDLIFKGGQWALVTVGNKIRIIKDMNEKFTPQVRARIGGIKYPSGLSFLPDAITFATNMLSDHICDRKYIFFITDGHSLGYENIENNFETSAKEVFKNGINMIGIGVAQGQSKFFTNSFCDPDFRKTIAKFIGIYFDISQQNM